MPLSPDRRPSWLRRVLWALDAAGRLYTFAALVGIAMGAGAVVAVVVRAVSRLSAPWLALLGVGAAAMIIVVGGVVLAAALGARLVASQAQLYRVARIFRGSLTLYGDLLVSKRDRSTPAMPVRVILRRLKGDAPWRRRRIEGRLVFKVDTSVEHGYSVYSVTFTLPQPRRMPEHIVARVDLVDQFNCPHRNKVEFPYAPELGPWVSTSPGRSPRTDF